MRRIGYRLIGGHIGVSAVLTLIIACHLLNSQCEEEAYEGRDKARKYNNNPLPLLKSLKNRTKNNGYKQYNRRQNSKHHFKSEQLFIRYFLFLL